MTRRTRRRYFLVVLAALSLVFNQWVVAAHWCPVAASVVSSVTDETDSHGHHHNGAVPQSQAHCASAAMAVDHNDAGCQAHCADPAKSDTQAKTPSVPALFGPEPMPARVLAPIALHLNGQLAQVHTAHLDRRRRIDEFSVLLI